MEVQWLRLCVSKVQGMGSTPGLEQRSYKLHTVVKKKKKEHVYIVCLHAEATF